MSAYLLEHQVVVNSQLFQAHHKEEDIHEILKLEVARLPERYQDLAWSLVRKIYCRALGNQQLLDPIFENLIKVAESNAIFWDKMKLVKEKAKDIEQSYDDLISAASSIAHFDCQFPLDLPVKNLEKCHERRQVQRLDKRANNCHSNNPKKKCTVHSSRGHNRNECLKEYEHHFAFMVNIRQVTPFPSQK
jgi:hypothetical protein